MSLRTQAGSFRSASAGGSCTAGGTKAQCSAHSAPCAIQRRSVAIWAGESGSPSGGIRVHSSSALTRAISSPASGSPGTTARPPESSSAVILSNPVSDSPASASSGP